MNTRLNRSMNDNAGTLASARQVVETVPILMRLIRSAVRQGGTLSVPQLRVLGFVSLNPGSGISELSAALDVTPPTASALVDRLVKKRLIIRKENPLERRRTRLTLTEEGRRILEEARLNAQVLVAEVLGAETPEQLAKINEGLALLAEAAKTYRSERAPSSW